MSGDFDNMTLLCTTESMDFASEVKRYLQRELGKGVEVQDVTHAPGNYFPNREIYVQIPGNPNVRRFNVYFFHSFCGYDGSFDPNLGLMKLYLFDEALRNAEPAEINYVLPFMPYLRQDRKDRPRVPISAKRVLNMLYRPSVSSIPTRIFTFDMHAEQVEGFTDYPIRNLHAEGLFEGYLRGLGLKDIVFVGVEGKGPDEPQSDVVSLNEQLKHEPVIVSPDTGGATRARRFAKRFGASIAIIDKRRTGAGMNEAMNLVGADYVQGRTAVLMDDMIDTGGTARKGAKLLAENGAEEVYACAVHGLFSNYDGTPTEERMREAGLNVVTTNTIPRSHEYKDKNKDWLTFLSVCPKTAEAVMQAQKRGGSVSTLFGRDEGVKDGFKQVK